LRARDVPLLVHRLAKAAHIDGYELWGRWRLEPDPGERRRADYHD
jgi:hypothetical protein